MRYIWHRLVSIWERLNPEQRLYAFTTIIGLSLVLPFLAFNLSQNTRITIASVVSAEGIGSACGPILYDGTGKLRGITGTASASFDAPAPIYLLDPAVIRSISKPRPPGYGCAAVPEVITPTLATQGTPLYPLYFKVSSPDQWVTSGESFQIDTTIGITNSFASKGLFFAIPFTPTEKIDVQLFLHTTTFDFSPSNEQVYTQELSLSSSPQQTWILSPKADVVGNQTMLVSIRDNKERLQYQRAKISLEVRPLTGIRPEIAAIVTAIGTLLLGIFGIAKVFLEVQELNAKRRATNQSTATAQKPARNRRRR